MDEFELLDAGLNKTFLIQQNDFEEYYNIPEDDRVVMQEDKGVKISELHNVNVIYLDADNGSTILEVENTIEVITDDKIVLTFLDDYANVKMTIILDKK